MEWNLGQSGHVGKGACMGWRMSIRHMLMCAGCGVRHTSGAGYAQGAVPRVPTQDGMCPVMCSPPRSKDGGCTGFCPTWSLPGRGVVQPHRQWAVDAEGYGHVILPDPSFSNIPYRWHKACGLLLCPEPLAAPAVGVHITCPQGVPEHRSKGRRQQLEI